MVDSPSAQAPQEITASHQELVLLLRREGPLTAEDLAMRVGMSRTAALVQLHALEELELVERRAVRHGVGRPRHLYDVTARAQELLPAGYEDFSLALVDAARGIGGQELLGQLLDARRRDMTAAVRSRLRARGLDSASLAERTGELAAIQDELGYVCEASHDDVIRLREHNCPILKIAATSSAVCKAELRMITEVLEADVRRESHIAGGDRTCTYVIEPRRWDVNQPRVWDSKQMRFAPR